MTPHFGEGTKIATSIGSQLRDAKAFEVSTTACGGRNSRGHGNEVVRLKATHKLKNLGAKNAEAFLVAFSHSVLNSKLSPGAKAPFGVFTEMNVEPFSPGAGKD